EIHERQFCLHQGDAGAGPRRRHLGHRLRSDPRPLIRALFLRPLGHRYARGRAAHHTLAETMIFTGYVSLPSDWRLPDLPPWELTTDLAAVIERSVDKLPSGYVRRAPGIAIHPSATVEPGAVLKPPCIIGENCFVAAYAYLRGGVWLAANVILGPS